MADLSVLTRLDRLELTELVSVLAYLLGDLPDRAVAEARFHAATRRAQQASDAAEAALSEYVRMKGLHDKAIAEKRRSTLGGKLGRLADGYRVACDREQKAFARLGQLRLEDGQ